LKASGLREEGGRDLEAEGFGRLQIDEELKSARLLDRKVGWLAGSFVKPTLSTTTA